MKTKLGLIMLVLFAFPAFAGAEESLSEVAYVLNTFAFLINGILVMWMAAGFAMLESGLVRTKNVATICMKNIGLFGIAGILYYLVGYNLMYAGVDSGFIGSFSIWGADDAAAAAGDYAAGYSTSSDWDEPSNLFIRNSIHKIFTNIRFIII